MDYKEWITQRAEELAQERYGKDVSCLDGKAIQELLIDASCDYWDKHGALIDAQFDMAYEKQMMEGD